MQPTHGGQRDELALLQAFRTMAICLDVAPKSGLLDRNRKLIYKQQEA
jgi:hypothetical protein